MSVEKLKECFKKGVFPPVILMCGDNEYIKQFYINKIKDTVKASPVPEMNLSVFDGENTAIDIILDSAETPAYMFDRKVIIVNGFPLEKNNDSLNRLVDYFFSPSPDTLLLLVYRAGKISSKALQKKEKCSFDYFLEAVSQNGFIVEFQKETGDRLSSWISRHFTAKSIPAEKNAIDFLPVFCGNDMFILSVEIDKLCAFYHDKPISVEDVENVCCPNVDYQTFDLTNSITEKSHSKWIGIYENLKLKKVAPELILGAISKNFCDMLAVKLFITEGKTLSDIKQALKQQEWILKRIYSSVSKTDVEYIKNAVFLCSDADKQLKSFSGDPYLVIELLILGVQSYARA